MLERSYVRIFDRQVVGVADQRSLLEQGHRGMRGRGRGNTTVRRHCRATRGAASKAASWASHYCAQAFRKRASVQEPDSRSQHLGAPSTWTRRLWHVEAPKRARALVLPCYCIFCGRTSTHVGKSQQLLQLSFASRVQATVGTACICL